MLLLCIRPRLLPTGLCVYGGVCRCPFFAFVYPDLRNTGLSVLSVLVACAVRETMPLECLRSFHFEVVGAGGHGAMPSQAHDPITACASAVQNINSFVARENDYTAVSSGFVSVTQIQVRDARTFRCSLSASGSLCPPSHFFRKDCLRV